jgi:hypothetical protein
VKFFSQALSLCSVLVAISLGVVAGFLLHSDARILTSWLTASATVEDMRRESMGAILKLYYDDRSVSLFHSLAPWNAQRFQTDYAVDTQHPIRVNPSNPDVVKLEPGWNSETLLPTLFLIAICAAMLRLARTLWKMGNSESVV